MKQLQRGNINSVEWIGRGDLESGMFDIKILEVSNDGNFSEQC